MSPTTPPPPTKNITMMGELLVMVKFKKVFIPNNEYGSNGEKGNTTLRGFFMPYLIMSVAVAACELMVAAPVARVRATENVSSISDRSSANTVSCRDT